MLPDTGLTGALSTAEKIRKSISDISMPGLDLVISALGALFLYKPFGTGGIVAGTGIGTIAAVLAQAVVLRREFDGLELGRLAATTAKITLAAAALAVVSFGVWDLLDNALGRGLGGQIVSLGTGLGLGGLTYLLAAKLLKIAELEQITRLLRRR